MTVRWEYVYWEQTPLKWHKLMTYLGFPLGILTQITTLASTVSSLDDFIGTGVAYLFYLDIFYSLLSIGLSVAAIVGNQLRRWFGPQCIMVLSLSGLIYNIYVLWLGIQIQADPSTMSSNLARVLTSAIILPIVYYYYQKRRLIFTPSPPAPQPGPASPSEPSNFSAQPQETPSTPKVSSSRPLLIALSAICVCLTCLCLVLFIALQGRLFGPHPVFVANARQAIPVYHLLDCDYADGISPSYRVYYETEEAARYDGKTPCYRCITGSSSLSVAPTPTPVLMRNYVASMNGSKYHRLSCKYTDRILEENRVYYSTTYDAKVDGKSPCSVCQPQRASSASSGNSVEERLEMLQKGGEEREAYIRQYEAWKAQQNQ